MDDFEPNPEVDAVFSALRHPWRRWVLAELTTDSPRDLEPLAQHLVSRNRDAAGAGFRRVYLSLLHIHIPKLQKSGLVQYDPGTRTVRPSEQYADDMEAAIEELERLEEGPS